MMPLSQLARTSACALVVMSVSVCGNAQDTWEDKTLSLMVAAGIPTQAMDYATAQRNLWRQDPERYARWTMRVLHSQAQMALRKTDPDADWKNCHSIYAQFEDSAPDNPRLPWVGWQRSNCDLRHAQASLANFLAAPARQELRDLALKIIRDILRDTDVLAEDIRRRQPLSVRQTTGQPPQASAEQLSELLVDVGLLQCEALLVRMRLYPPDSLDRTAAATDVATRAYKILSLTSEEWPSRDSLRVAKARAELELGKADEALLELVQIASESSGASVPQAAQAAIEFLARTGELSRARSLLQILAESEAGTGPELQLAQLSLELAELDETAEPARDEKMKQLILRSEEIGSRFGAYWRNRADALLLGGRPTASTGTTEASSASLDLMFLEIRQLLAADKQAQAIAKLIEFRDNALANGQRANSLKLATSAFALLQRQKKWLEAADSIEETAKQAADEVDSAAAHLRAVFALSQALRLDAKNRSVASRYEQSLLSHLSVWPEASNTDEAQGWLRSWLIGNSRGIEFTQALQRRAANCTQTEQARAVLHALLAEILKLPQEQRSLAIKELQGGIAERSFGNANNHAALVAAAAEFFAQWPNAERVRELNSQLASLRSSISEPSDLQLVNATRLLQLARTGDLRAARDLAQNWQPSELPAAVRLSLLPALVEAVATIDGQQPASWVNLLQFDEGIVRALTKEKQPPLVQAAGFRILIWEQQPNAIRELIALAGKHPRDGRIQLHLADAYSELGGEEIANSTRLARRVIASSPAGTDLHFMARWRVLRNLLLTGDADTAGQKAKLLLASQPIDSEIWKQRFEKIADR